MQTRDLFAVNRSPKRLNEAMSKVFGKKLNLEAFSLPQLEDARNKLRTQVSQVRSSTGFNENLESDAFHQAQFMLDAINAEIMQRETVTVESPEDTGNPYGGSEEDMHADPDPNEYDREGDMAKDDLTTAEEAAEELKSILDSDENLPEWVQAKITKAVDYLDTARDYMNAQDHDEVDESAPKGWEGTVKAMKKHKEIDNPYALAHYMKNKGYKSHKKESIGENMKRLSEGEIQQAQSIVTAKTMVDRVGRWIEELSGMENDTLLQLGDTIRDEMGQEAAKSFISAVAPAIQQALENLKATRDTLSTNVRNLATGEAPADMLGAPEPGSDMEGPAASPDSMNMDEPMDLSGDEFGAAEPAAGGAETAGREKRESVDRSNRLLKVLAG